MDDSIFIIFIVFGSIWALIGAIGVIALIKMDGGKVRIGKTGLLVALPIIAPIIIALTYAAVKGIP
jgi:hypothetical protein